MENILVFKDKHLSYKDFRKQFKEHARKEEIKGQPFEDIIITGCRITKLPKKGIVVESKPMKGKEEEHSRLVREIQHLSTLWYMGYGECHHCDHEIEIIIGDRDSKKFQEILEQKKANITESVLMGVRAKHTSFINNEITFNDQWNEFMFHAPQLDPYPEGA